MNQMIIRLTLSAALLGLAAPARSQQQDSVSIGQNLKNAGKDIGQAGKKTGQEIGHAGQKAGQKSASLGRKGISKVVDQVYTGKAGPQGQTIYINNKDQYYYVDGKGHRIYLRKKDLKDK